MSKLEWAKLLSEKRERPKSQPNTYKNQDFVVRNEFEADYDRIVGSSSVRRLQDKAQVFPLQEDDVARTRLTHSIEVSAMARSLGKAVGRSLEKQFNNEFTPEDTDKLAALLQVSGLIHDLGNPAFGHYGETIIQEWFKKYFESHSDLKLSKQEKKDFIRFDGNVQNLRIVSKLQTQNDTYGANFTYGTLATIMKYPWNSEAKKKKFGYFKSEEELAIKIRKELGLNDNVRHPATYLLEAADDIIYLCDDIEDGVKKGYINWDIEYDKIKNNLNFKSSKLKDTFGKIDNKYIDERMNSNERIIAHARNFRNIIQSYLFNSCIKEFIENYNNIMSNNYNEGYELLKAEKELVDELKRVTSENCFSCHEVIALELEGDKVISTLLNVFVNTLLSNPVEDLLNSSKYCGKIFSLISPNFIYSTINNHATREDISNEIKRMEDDINKYKIEKLKEISDYDKLHLVTDFISGMTDSYAVKLYQELCGVRHP